MKMLILEINKEVNGEDLNPIHWAVYTNNLNAIKTIIKNQIFNIVIAGKVPSNTGMANDSEISMDAATHDVHLHDLDDQSGRKERTFSESKFGSIPRSLILFWPIDQEIENIFDYLWNDLEINWGLKTLKFILTMI